MFTENKADETFHVTYTYLYSMAGRRDIDRTYKCLSEWRFFLVKSCICSFILSCFWQPYECVTGVWKVFWVVVSRYVWYSLCFSIFFLVSFVVGSLWVVLRSSSVIWRSLWVVPGFSDYWSVGWKPNYVTLNNPESYKFYKNFILSETIK